MAAKKNEPVDVDLTRATRVEPGDPEETPALSQMGATFAERQKAREKAEKKAAAKSVKPDAAEDKSVSSASTKSAKKK